LYVFVLIAPHGIILFLDGVSERIPSGWGREQRGFSLALLLRVGFPPVLDMAEQLTPIELNIDCLEQARTDQIMDTQIKHT
jgi:hypothetical protein